MGEPTRVVISGMGPIPGTSMVEKRQYLVDSLDHIRTALMHEPRGHSDMFGAIILESRDPRADFGIIFMDGGGYLHMCGHGAIGAVTVALEMGLLGTVEPVTKVTLDTPAGLVFAKAEVEDQSVKSVTIQNVPSFLYREALPLDIPGVATIEMDIAFGGNFCALVAAADLGLEIVPENAGKLLDDGMRILKLLKSAVEVNHPAVPHIRSVDLVEICGPAQASGADARNVVVFGHGQFDRSPCGTGTCAKMATLFAKGELGLGQDFVHESIIGTTFRGRLIGEKMVGKISAVIPEITGQAFITGIQQFLIDPADPLKYGFSVEKAV